MSERDERNAYQQAVKDLGSPGWWRKMEEEQRKQAMKRAAETVRRICRSVRHV